MDPVTGAQVAHRNPAEQAGFTMYPNAILTAGSLSLGARVLYGLLKMYAWQNGQAWPGQDRLGTDMGVSARQVRTYLAELETAGLVSKEQRGLTQTNKYWIEPIPATFLSDRKNTSGQEGNNTSVQDRKPTSDKEYADQEYTMKNSERGDAPAPAQGPYPANPAITVSGDLSTDPDWDNVGHATPKGTPIQLRPDRPAVHAVPKPGDDPALDSEWATLVATFPHRDGAGKVHRPKDTRLAWTLAGPKRRAQILTGARHLAAGSKDAQDGFGPHLLDFIQQETYISWQTPATPRPARSTSDPTRPPAPTYRILNAPAATSA